MLRKSTTDAIRSTARGRTGALVVTDRRSGMAGRVFLIEGEPYAVGLDGHEPDVLARLHAAGAIDDGQRAALTSAPHPGRQAVERGWVSVDALADIHTELLVAGLGALLDRERVSVRLVEGQTTDVACALPASLDELIALTAVRRERTAATWRAVTASGTPHDTGLTVTATPAVGDAPELAAFLAACRPGVSVDGAAAATGLTRAEAVHLSALAVLQHRATAAPVSVTPQHALDVPEQFGQVVLVAAPALQPDDLPALTAQVARLERELEDARRRLAAASAGAP